MFFSYHVHSNLSDGEAEISEIIRTASEMSLDEIGLSDHYVLTPDRRMFHWSMPPDGIEDYVTAVQSAAGLAADGLIVRMGLEADFIPEAVTELKAVLQSQPFDYVIGSVHLVDGFLTDSRPQDWDTFDQTERDKIIRKYWIRVAEMAESGIYDIVGHMDLIKKFAIYPSVQLSKEIDLALDAIARSGMSVELNTSGWHQPCQEAYPSRSIIEGCFKRGIPMLVSADSHNFKTITRDFERAYELLRDVGYTEISSYAGRERIMQPIPHTYQTNER